MPDITQSQNTGYLITLYHPKLFCSSLTMYLSFHIILISFWIFQSTSTDVYYNTYRRPQVKIKICYSRIYLVIVHTLAPHTNGNPGQRNMNTIDISITNKILVCSKVTISIIDPAEILIQGNGGKSYFSKLFQEAGGPGKFFPVLGISNTAEFIKQQKSGLIPGLILIYRPENIAKLLQANLWIIGIKPRPAGALISFPEPSWILTFE